MLVEATYDTIFWSSAGFFAISGLGIGLSVNKKNGFVTGVGVVAFGFGLIMTAQLVVAGVTSSLESAGVSHSSTPTTVITQDVSPPQGDGSVANDFEVTAAEYVNEDVPCGDECDPGVPHGHSGTIPGGYSSQGVSSGDAQDN